MGGLEPDAKRQKVWGAVQGERTACFLHGKMRAADCLEPDENGNMVCIKDNPCKVSFDTKSVMCSFWRNGKCAKGESCPFAHSEDAIPAEESLAAAGKSKDKGKGKGKIKGKKGGGGGCLGVGCGSADWGGGW